MMRKKQLVALLITLSLLFYLKMDIGLETVWRVHTENTNRISVHHGKLQEIVRFCVLLSMIELDFTDY